jgi:hypothetical protein
VCGVAGTYYYNHIYILPKLEYNAIHPFTSWIPLTLFIILRNVTPSLRNVHIAGYAWLGKVRVPCSDTKLRIGLVGISDGEIAHAAVSLRPPIPLYTIVPRTHSTRTTRKFEICPSSKGHFLSRRGQTLPLRFATFASLYASLLGGTASTWVTSRCALAHRLASKPL